MTAWMNRYDIHDRNAWAHSLALPNLKAAAKALRGLMEWTDDNGDGWPYWSKPSAAAGKLMDALEEKYVEWRNGRALEDLTSSQFKKALAPVKSFLARQGADWREIL